MPPAQGSNSSIPGPHTRGACPRLVFVACVVLAGSGPAVQADAVRYVLRPEPSTGRVHVEVSWETSGRTRSALGVSKRYGTIDDVPSLLSEPQFGGVTGVQRDAARWILQHRNGATIRCTYTVDARTRKFDWNSTYLPIVTETFFHGVGNAFLMTPESGVGGPTTCEFLIRWELPRGWKAACSWGGVGPHVGDTVAATDVRHSVYVAGELVTQSSRRDGLDVTVAIVDAFGFKAGEFLNMAADIVRDQCAFMSETEFPPFLVTAIPVGTKLKEGEARLSGMGLYNSFALCVAPESQLNDAVEHLFAHELFHYWNGRVLGAAQPERRVYWFVEGLTDYYALRILHESGRWDAARFARWINKHIREYHANPAIGATNEEIDARYWDARDTVGEMAYQRGLMLGLRWHRRARDAGVREGLDRLFKALVERGRAGGFELSNTAIRSAGRTALGPWFEEDFDRHVVRAEPVELPADALEPALTGKVRPVYEFELGFERTRSLKEKRVIGLVDGSPAAQAGLQEGDELSGWRIPTDADTKAEIQVRRAGKVRTIAYYPRGAKREVLQFTPVRKPQVRP